VPLGWGLRIVARGGASGARSELGFRMKNGQGLGCNLRVGTGWSETVHPGRRAAPAVGAARARRLPLERGLSASAC
jgi:hypothetical protein